MLLSANSIVEQALDPSQVKIAPEALWTVFGAMLGFTLGGLFILWLIIRKFGKPGGELRREDLPVAFPLSICAVAVHVTLVGWLWTRSPLQAGIAQSMLALACILLLGLKPWRREGQQRAQWIRTRPWHLALMPVVWGMAVPVLLAAMFAAVALAQLADMPVTMQGPIANLRSQDSLIWIVGWYVAAAVGAPLLEEFVFRVVVLGGLMGLMKPLSEATGWKHPGTWVALLVSGGLFVLAHGVWDWTVGIIPLSALTFLLSSVYLHTRSIWTCVLLHGTHNAFVVSVQFFVLM